jgi:UDP-GlcNAc:undecaprenyl-phosphate GlcNAc-1-phosphate transferase
MIAAGLFVLSFAFVASYTATVIRRQQSIRSGFMDIPFGRKDHNKATPLGGGQAMWLAFLLTIMVGYAAAYASSRGWHPWWLPSVVSQEARGILDKFPKVLLILACGTGMMILGWIDDRKDLPPGPKLLAQIVLASIVVAGGISVTVFISSKLIAGIVTVVWIVTVVNAFNFLDNMDGLCAGIAMAAGAVFTAVALMTGQVFVAMMLLAYLGVLGGFLIFNFPPASIFMGDAGSFFTGYMLAILTVVFTFRENPEPIYTIFIPILILIVPLFDMTYVVGMRLIKRQPLSVGDHNHISHRLISLGMTPRLAAVTIYLMTFCTALAAVMLRWMGPAGAICAAAQVICFLTLIFIIEGVGRKT